MTDRHELTHEITVSIVVPVYSGSEYLADLVQEVESLRLRWQAKELGLAVSELIFALDAPIDNSQELLRELSAWRPWMRLVELSRHSGQHSATVAGLAAMEVLIEEEFRGEDLRLHPVKVIKVTSPNRGDAWEVLDDGTVFVPSSSGRSPSSRVSESRTDGRSPCSFPW